MEEALQQYLASRAQIELPSSVAGKVTHDSRVEDARSAFNRVLARQTGVVGLGTSFAGDAQKLKDLQDLSRRIVLKWLAQLKQKYKRN
jgi:hypothetical protein